MNSIEEKKGFIQKSLDSVYNSYQSTKKHKKDFLKHQKQAMVDKKLSKHYQKYAKKSDNLLGKITGKHQKLQTKADFYKVGSKVNQNRSQKAMDKTLSTGFSKGVGIAVVVAAAAATSYVIYKKYFAKAAKACVGKTGIDKKICIQNFRKQAIKVQISSLQRGMNNCNNSKNPEKCKQKIQDKINKLKTKLG